jgi:hypothetical protein
LNDVAYPEIYAKFHEKLSNDVAQGKIQNNIIFSLQNVKQIREEGEERQELRLVFKKTTYLHHRTMLAVWQSLDDQTKWNEIKDQKHNLHPKFATSFGVQIGIITKDNYLVFSKRANTVTINPNLMICTMTEGMSSADVDKKGNPDIFNTAKRGLNEELGVNVRKKGVHLTTLFINFTSFHVGFYGYIDMRSSEGFSPNEQLTFEELEERWKNGPKDYYETARLEAVEFTLNALRNYIIEKKIGGGTLIGLVHLLTTHFGYDTVRLAFKEIYKPEDLK